MDLRYQTFTNLDLRYGLKICNYKGLDLGYFKLDLRYLKLDLRYFKLDLRYFKLDLRYFKLDLRYRSLDLRYFEFFKWNLIKVLQMALKIT